MQRAYYARTAHRYDDMHVHEDDAHGFALRFMISVVEHLGIKSILDIGCGTGRALLEIKREMPNITAVGIEPSSELRKVGHAKGLLEAELIDGDAMNLALSDGSFDLVCEFGALHHMHVPSKAVSEMLRVARRAIFVSDGNNFGQGTKGLSAVEAGNRRGWALAFGGPDKNKGKSLHDQRRRWRGVFIFGIQ